MKLIALFLIFSNSVLGMSGKDVAEKVYNSNREKHAIYDYEMKLINKNKSEKTREFILLYLDKEKYNAKSLIVFKSPKVVKNTSMLTFNTKKSNSQQWLYLPALKKTRRISSAKKNGRFVGSDLTYEDFENREVVLDNHKLLKSKDKNYYILKSWPKDKSSSQYSKVISKVDKKRWIIKEAKFYKNKKVHKIVYNKKFKKIGKTWQSFMSVVINKDIQHKTILKLKNVNFKKRVLENNLSKRTMESGSALKSIL